MSDDNVEYLRAQRLVDDAPPVIRIHGGELHEYAAAAEAVLAADLYLRGSRLVRLGKAIELPTAQRIVRSADQSVLVAVNQEYLRRELTRRVCFQRFDGRAKKWVDIDCPANLAANILAVAESKHWRPLTAIARAPFLRPDLSVCEQPGYDSATAVYLEPSEAFPPIAQSPSKADAERALAVLRAPFDQFPYQTRSSESVFLAHVLTAVVRPALDTTPVFFFTAPSVATGKTLLATIASMIASGNIPAIRPYSDDADEQRKVLLGALLAGDPTLLFDNLLNGSKVRSPTLCAFATSARYGDRQLGASDSTTMVNALLLVLTGNNLTPAGDLARRSVVCRLDTNAESARGRQFKIPNLQDYVLEHRAELLVAALTIIRAYAVAGAPSTAKLLESFEQWTRVVAGPLTWLGMSDPTDSQEAETEDDHAAQRIAFAAIEALYHTDQFTAKKIAGEMGVVVADLRTSLETAGCSDASSATKIGYWLRANRDVVAGGYKLVAHKGHAGSAVWQLRAV